MKLRLSGFIMLLCALGTGGLLFWSSQSVQSGIDTRESVKADIAREIQSIRVLRAEWDYLNHPQRLEVLARDYLFMQLPDMDRVVEDAAMIPQSGVPIVPLAKPMRARVLVRDDVMLTQDNVSFKSVSPAPQFDGVLLRALVEEGAQ
jgi:hypothetical protein